MFDREDGRCGASEGASVAPGGGGGGAAKRGAASWRTIDRELRRVARSQAALDAEELRWLALAQEVELHDQLGMASMLEYVERVLGYGPKAGIERLRVARELTELPRLAAALQEGRVSFSAVRELSRKATAATEEEWLAAAHGKCLREIEELLSGHKKGDRPGDPIDPDLRMRKITLELTPPTLALYRDACRRLEDELGHRLTDDETIAAMCATVLGGDGCGVGIGVGVGVGVGDHACACEDTDDRAGAPRRHDDGNAPSPRDDGDAPSQRDDGDALSPRDDGDSPSPREDGNAPSPREDGNALSPREDGNALSPRGAADEPVNAASREVGVTVTATSTVTSTATTRVRAPRTRTTPPPRVAPYQIALTVCPTCDRGWHDAGGRAIAVPDSTIAQAICDAQYIGETDLAVPARAYQEIPPAIARLVLRRDRGCCRVPGCRSARWLHIHHIVPREHGGSNDPSNLACLCFAHHQALHQGKIAITGTAPDALVFDLSAYDLAHLGDLDAPVPVMPGARA